MGRKARKVARTGGRVGKGSKVLAAVALGGSLVAPNAFGQQERPVMVVAGTTVSHNSNVFSLADGVDPQGALGTSRKSDVITSGFVGLRVDQPWGLQRFLFDATYSAVRYQRFTHLNYDPLQYRGAWQWRLTPRISGVASADRSEVLANYADVGDPNLRTVRIGENRSFSANARIIGGWELTGAARQEVRRNSTPIAEEGSYRADGGDAGIRYVATSGSSLTVQARRLEGRYLDRAANAATLLDDGFVRDEREILANWVLTGRSSIDGRLARIHYRSNSFAERDFAGKAALLNARWQATGRLALSFNTSRDVTPFQSLESSFRQDRRYGAQAAWSVAARLSARLGYTHQISRFGQPVAGGSGTEQEDTLRTVDLGAEWRALRNLTVNASLQRTRRESNQAGARYGATIATVGGSLAF